jgi:hypothetical protein
MQELEGLQIVWQSAVRKLQRWQRKKKLLRSASPVEMSAKATANALLLEAPSPAEAWLEANTTRRGGKLVLKPGVPPYDPSTALTLGEESTEESLPFSKAPDVGRCLGSSSADAVPTANAESWTMPTFKQQQSQAQHQRKTSEDDSQETSPTVVSAVDDDASATDEEESPDFG